MKIAAPPAFRPVPSEEWARCHSTLSSLYTGDPEGWPSLIDVAQEHGFELALCQWVLRDVLERTEREDGQ